MTTNLAFQTADSSSSASYIVSYVGCMSVDQSMRSLQFDVRTALARECIYRVCEAVAAISPNRSRRVHPAILTLLPRPAKTDINDGTIQLFRRNAELCISTSAVSVFDTDSVSRQRSGCQVSHSSALDQRPVLLSQPLPNVSFAAGGDEDAPEFICFIAKEDASSRHCYVFECDGTDQAKEVLQALGQAFSQRLEELGHQRREQQQQQLNTFGDLAAGRKAVRPTVLPPPHGGTPPSPQLIDWHVPADPTNTRRPAHPYVNDAVVSKHHDKMRFSPADPLPPPAPSHEELLECQGYYHGTLLRAQAEALLQADGDFLVRRSANDATQFVLTGMQAGIVHHLLLVDAQSRVRTRDREFQNIPHLIKYHLQHNIPITSAESAVVLKRSICRQGVVLPPPPPTLAETLF